VRDLIECYEIIADCIKIAHEKYQQEPDEQLKENIVRLIQGQTELKQFIEKI